MIPFKPGMISTNELYRNLYFKAHNDLVTISFLPFIISISHKHSSKFFLESS